MSVYHVHITITILIVLSFANPPVKFTGSKIERPAKEIQSSKKIVGRNSDSSVIVFTGRTPCREFAADYGISVPDDCFKLKWKIILYTAQASGTSGTYLLQTTFNRQKDIKGTWTVSNDQGTGGRTIYQLNNILNGKNLYLLSLDNEVVFFLRNKQELYKGNEEFSYTLNKEGRR